MTELRKAAERALGVLLDPNTRADEVADAVKTIRQALAESANSTTNLVESKALAQPEQEPVCFLRETSWSYEIAPWDDPNGIPVYTAPPQKEWVGLTTHEVYVCWKSGDVVAAVEAKLKEKNT